MEQANGARSVNNSGKFRKFLPCRYINYKSVTNALGAVSLCAQTKPCSQVLEGKFFHLLVFRKVYHLKNASRACPDWRLRGYFVVSQYRSAVNLGWGRAVSPASVRIKKRSYSVCAIGDISGAPSARRTMGSVASCQTTSTLVSLLERIASINFSGMLNGIATGFKCSFSARGAAVCCVRCRSDVKIC